LLPWWLSCGYGLKELLWAAAETVLWQALVVAFALPLAAVTNGFSRYFLWTLVVIAAVMTVAIFLLFAPQVPTRSAYDLLFVWTRGWLALAVFLVGGCIAAARQFHARRLDQAFLIFGGGAALAIAVLGFWPRSLTPAPPLAPEEKLGPVAERIGLTFDQARIERTGEKHADLLVAMKFSGVPESLIVTPSWDITREGQMPARHTWTWGTGLTLERQGWIQTGGQRIEAEWVALGLTKAPGNPAEVLVAANAQRRRNGLAPIVPRGEGRFGDLRVQVPTAFAARTRTEPPEYRLRVQLDLVRPERGEEKPLQVGTTLRVGRNVGRVARLEFDRQGLGRTSTLIETGPLLLWEGGHWSFVPLLRTGLVSQQRYYVVNRAHRNAVEAGNVETWGRFGTVKIGRRALSNSTPWDWRDGEWRKEPDWFAGLTIAVVTHHWEERFTKEIRVAPFALSPEATPATP